MVAAARTSDHQMDPNDRNYDGEIVKKFRKLKPDQIMEILSDDNDD
jgi:hypothetical protein